MTARQGSRQLRRLAFGIVKVISAKSILDRMGMRRALTMHVLF
jgi:hypothetical protein